MTDLRQALAQTEQEPYGYFRYDMRLDAWVQNRENTKGVAFYTAPPKREWVGLTDDEIAECKIDGGLPHAVNWRLSAKVLQAKLKEKNA